MNNQSLALSFEVYDSIEELPEDDATLLRAAQLATRNSYAPYSSFHVGAAAKLSNGAVITGTNQENASYPVGMCAERVLLSAVSAVHPDTAIDSIAISYQNDHGSSNKPIAPCGICRQTLSEYESRFKKPIRLILGGMQGRVFVIPQASILLPLQFSADDMETG